MKTKSITIIALLCFLVSSCSKETATPTESKNTTPTAKESVLSMLCHEWVLSETYYDDQLKTTNGTELYRFDKNGTFWNKQQGMWKNIGIYSFFNSDSTALNVIFGVDATSEFLWQVQKLNDKEFKTEFAAGGRKLNYNYIRK